MTPSLGTIHVRFTQPPWTPYWSMAASAGGLFTQIRMHWDKPSEDMEFSCMDDFYDFCRQEKIRVPWMEDEEQPWLTPEGEKEGT